MSWLLPLTLHEESIPTVHNLTPHHYTFDLQYTTFRTKLGLELTVLTQSTRADIPLHPVRRRNDDKTHRTTLGPMIFDPFYVNIW